MATGIIGGGIHGTAMAYFLAAFGDESVVLFERDHVGGTSTSRSAGIVRHHYPHESHVAIAARGRDLLANLEELIGRSGGFRETGYLIVAGEDRADAFRETVRTQRRIGIDVTLLSPDELPDYHPHVDPEGLTVGAIEHESGFADPYQVATGFAEAARGRGVDIRTDTEVVDLRVEDDRVTAVETDAGVQAVDRVVDAAGPRLGDVAAMAGVDVPVTWRESKVVVLSSSTDYGVDLPTLSDKHLNMYVKPEPGGDFLVGGIDRPEFDPGRGLEGVSNEFLLEVQERLERRLPTYADAEVVNTWSGILTLTPDLYQVAGFTDAVPNLFVLGGGSGHGFKEAAAFAESGAQLILGEQPEHDLHPYRPGRFEEGDTFETDDAAKKTHR